MRGNFTSYTQTHNTETGSDTDMTLGQPTGDYKLYEAHLEDFGVNRFLLFVEEANHLNNEVRRETTDFRLKCINTQIISAKRTI